MQVSHNIAMNDGQFQSVDYEVDFSPVYQMFLTVCWTWYPEWGYFNDLSQPSIDESRILACSLATIQTVTKRVYLYQKHPSGKLTNQRFIIFHLIKYVAEWAIIDLR